jgi:hypothetical protein
MPEGAIETTRHECRGPPPRNVGKAPTHRLGPAPYGPHVSVQGRVRGLRHRIEDYGEDSPTYTVWTFRLDRHDSAGNSLRPVPVQMRGAAFDGSLDEGDVVRVAGRWKDGTLHGERIDNLTTGAAITRRSFKLAGLIAFAVLVLLVVAGFFVVRNIIDDHSQDGREWYCEQAEEVRRAPVSGCE